MLLLNKYYKQQNKSNKLIIDKKIRLLQQLLLIKEKAKDN